MNLSQPASSTQIVQVVVTFLTSAGTTDPRGDVVQFAFTTPGTSPAVWLTGAWDATGPPYLAQILVGPSAPVTLTAGAWDMWLKVTDNPEIPVMSVGILSIY